MINYKNAPTRIGLACMLLLLCIDISFAHIGNVTVELDVENYSITKEAGDFDIINMDDFSFLLSPGKPILPLKHYNILIPPNAEDSSIQIHILSSEKKS